MSNTQPERRYTDQGEEQNLPKDVVGALERKLLEGDSFVDRSTGTPEFVSAVDKASKTFQLRAQTATETAATETAQNQTHSEATPTPKTQGPLILLSKSPHTPEHKKYLETTIQTALPSVRGAFTRAGIAIPSDDEILQAIIMTNRFTPDQIEALRRNIQVPGLIVLPPELQSFSAYAGFLNVNKKRRLQYDVSTGDSRKTAFSKQDKALEEERKVKPAEYKFGIGEMMQEPATRQGRLKDIVEKWERSDLAQLTRTATAREYAVLQAQAKDLMDLNGWTILSEENTPHKIIGDDSLVSGARDYSWGGGGGVDFYDSYPEGVYNRARVRPVVVG